MIQRLFAFCLFVSLSLYAEKVPFQNTSKTSAPWFTGPLLAPSSLTIPQGHYNIEPYLYAMAKTGRYGSDWKVSKISPFWNNYFQPLFQFGLTRWMDFQFMPTLFYNYTSGAGMWEVGDLSVLFDFQLYKYEGPLTEWTTAVKLVFKEIIPLGKYQNLKPSKLGADIGGAGSWQTVLGVVWGSLFYLGKGHFLAWRNSFQYTLPAPTEVKHLNCYGGGPSTRGTVYPAQNFQIDTAIELTLSQNWVFACDLVGNWFGTTRFKGKTSITNSAPTGAQFSLAPALEYNWNAHLGIIIGPWLTFAGRNSSRFAGGVFALNYYH